MKGVKDNLQDYSPLVDIHQNGIINSRDKTGFVLKISGIDPTFINDFNAHQFSQQIKSFIHLEEKEEIQIVFRKRVDFENWIKGQLKQAFASKNKYARKLLLEQLSSELDDLSADFPRLLEQEIIIVFWKPNKARSKKDLEACLRERVEACNQLERMGLNPQALKKEDILKEISLSANPTEEFSKKVSAQFPGIKIQPYGLEIKTDLFRALEIETLPEDFTEFGMIQSISLLPFSIDIAVHLKGIDKKNIVDRLEKKRNFLHAKIVSSNTSKPKEESQLSQIEEVLHNLAERSDSVLNYSMVVGVRAPKDCSHVLRKALGSLSRLGSEMGFCEFKEMTIGTFDGYLQTIPTYIGKNIKSHTLLASNVAHLLPFFVPEKGDTRPIINFHTRLASFFAIDPLDSKMGNYNWLVSGTSGSGKSFFVNSLIAQSMKLNPNIFIIDVGGSYNKLTQFFDGEVFSLDPKIGFKMSPFFLPPSSDPGEERLRREHIYTVFLEMLRINQELPPIEIRELLREKLEDLMKKETLPEHPITAIYEDLKKENTRESKRLALLLKSWTHHHFSGSFLDTNERIEAGKFVTFDLKGLSEFEDLSRVLQFLICALLWAKVRQEKEKYSWIVLDEVAFSLLRSQPHFVDELISTIRKYYAGVVIIVQDLEKITSSKASGSILQNTQSKAILQQRGDPRNFSEPLNLNARDLQAIESLERKKGAFSDILIIRDKTRSLIRHHPSPLEYWLSTTSPEDNQRLSTHFKQSKEQSFRKNILQFVKSLRRAA